MARGTTRSGERRVRDGLARPALSVATRPAGRRARSPPRGAYDRLGLGRRIRFRGQRAEEREAFFQVRHEAMAFLRGATEIAGCRIELLHQRALLVEQR